MPTSSDHAKARRWSVPAASEKLRDRGWTVAAAAAALILVAAISGGPLLPAIAGIVLVAAVAALTPRRDEVCAKQTETASSALTGILEITAANLAGAIADPLVVADGSGTVRYANAAARAAFGAIQPGTMLQHRFRAPEMREFLRRIPPPPEGMSIDYLERVPYERLHRITAFPIGEASKLTVILFKDQSEARRIDRMRADFIANASHELRTPLASIAGFIETLRGPARNDAKAREQFLQIMQDQTARMARLIDDLLSLSRLEMKPLLDPNVKVDLREVVRAVVTSLTHIATESGVVITTSLPDEDMTVTGNRDELFQVFENLLENACKYGHSGGRVEVSAQTEGIGKERRIAVTVRDFGPGIPEEHIPRVTERFYRVDAETSRAQKGTGLGLAIVKHILTRHGAWLAIASKVGKGAAFTVHFPAPQA